MYEFLDAGMPNTEPHTAIIVADMRGNRAQPVMSGNTATDFYADLGRRQLEFVMEHYDIGDPELEEVRGFLTARPKSFI